MLRYPLIGSVFIHIGQHYDQTISEQVFTDLEIPPRGINLVISSGSHASQTGEVMKRLGPIVDTLKPDLLLVVGDLTSTLAAALTAVKLRIPADHVKAGLRSFDCAMPEGSRGRNPQEAVSQAAA